MSQPATSERLLLIQEALWTDFEFMFLPHQVGLCSTQCGFHLSTSLALLVGLIQIEIGVCSADRIKCPKCFFMTSRVISDLNGWHPKLEEYFSPFSEKVLYTSPIQNTLIIKQEYLLQFLSQDIDSEV